ncbi:HD domain-containing phosphohydrolase [Paenibacillus camelliae]|uniref:HD domain-containing phosphohydrolase n=1 Tax=Paenibacillus camelliae TaxID=512410 RepID=UPI0020421405|nr:HD domain-containing phosphohydrolase [Paenibacillus camelliae]
MDNANKRLLPYFEQLLRLSDAVIITDSRHHICFVNETYERITGFAAHEVTGRKAGLLRTKHTPAETYQHMHHALSRNEPWSGVFTNRKRSGQLWHSSITITPYVVEEQTYYVGVFRELEQLQRGHYLDEQRAGNLQSSLLKVLAISCEIRDPGIENHLIRVQQLTELLVNRYNETQGQKLLQSYIQQIINGSILHDIGKSAIPEGILYKPGTLAPYERTIIEMHPYIGVDILDKINGELHDELFEDEFAVAKNIILHHHERWDGNGYPMKLKQTDIPLEARIVSVVDVFDALTSKRPYKEKWTAKAAIELLIEQKNKQFDAEIVDVFVTLYEDGLLD